jgi:hypothetical protein
MHIKKLGVGQIHYFLYLSLLRVCDDRCHLLDAHQFHLGSWSNMKEEDLRTISKEVKRRGVQCDRGFVPCKKAGTGRSK